MGRKRKKKKEKKKIKGDKKIHQWKKTRNIAMTFYALVGGLFMLAMLLIVLGIIVVP